MACKRPSFLPYISKASTTTSKAGKLAAGASRIFCTSLAVLASNDKRLRRAIRREPLCTLLALALAGPNSNLPASWAASTSKRHTAPSRRPLAVKRSHWRPLHNSCLACSLNAVGRYGLSPPALASAADANGLTTRVHWSTSSTAVSTCTCRPCVGSVGGASAPSPKATAPRSKRASAPLVSRCSSTCATRPRLTRMLSVRGSALGPASPLVQSTRRGSADAAVFPSGAGKAKAMPCRSLLI